MEAATSKLQGTTIILVIHHLMPYQNQLIEAQCQLSTVVI
jgi:hypothetical protein